MSEKFELFLFRKNKIHVVALEYKKKQTKDFYKMKQKHSCKRRSFYDTLHHTIAVLKSFQRPHGIIIHQRHAEKKYQDKSTFRQSLNVVHL